MGAAVNEPKAFASLSSGLLARMGHAKPAMRPQGFGGFGMASMSAAHEDLGWNDMGHEGEGAEPQPISADIVPITGEPPAVVLQQEELARELTPQPAPKLAKVAAAAKAVRAAPGSKGKAAFTLRLDPERHLKLRLVCAVEHRSAQQTVLAALDAFLETQPAVADLARSTARGSR